MVGRDALIERLSKEDGEFARAKEAHGELARRVEELERKPFLTPQDEIELKTLKKKKLFFKDQMERILQRHQAETDGAGLGAL